VSYGPEERLHAASRISHAHRSLEAVREGLASLRADLNEDDINLTADTRTLVRRASVLIVQAQAQLDQAREILP
jgi:hypothetical protein